jgi:hypothetical protein
VIGISKVLKVASCRVVLQEQSWADAKASKHRDAKSKKDVFMFVVV